MILALARGHAAAFNGVFFATVATVIPVLFLAIAVQGRMYQDLVDAYAARVRAFRAQMRAAESSGQLTLATCSLPHAARTCPGTSPRP